MEQRFVDKMVFQAVSSGVGLSACQSIDCMKQFLLGLEQVSPWERPFVANGFAKSTANLMISDDLSNFQDVIMKTFPVDVRYFNENRENDWELKETSKSPRGFMGSFSSCVEKIGADVQIRIFMPGLAPFDRYLISIEPDS